MHIDKYAKIAVGVASALIVGGIGQVAVLYGRVQVHQADIRRLDKTSTVRESKVNNINADVRVIKETTKSTSDRLRRIEDKLDKQYELYYRNIGNPGSRHNRR